MDQERIFMSLRPPHGPSTPHSENWTSASEVLFKLKSFLQVFHSPTDVLAPESLCCCNCPSPTASLPPHPEPSCSRRNFSFWSRVASNFAILFSSLGDEWAAVSQRPWDRCCSAWVRQPPRHMGAPYPGCSPDPGLYSMKPTQVQLLAPPWVPAAGRGDLPHFKAPHFSTPQISELPWAPVGLPKRAEAHRVS